MTLWRGSNRCQKRHKHTFFPDPRPPNRGRLPQLGSHRSQRREEAAGNDNDRLSVASEQDDIDDGRIYYNDYDMTTGAAPATDTSSSDSDAPVSKGAIKLAVASAAAAVRSLLLHQSVQQLHSNKYIESCMVSRGTVTVQILVAPPRCPATQKRNCGLCTPNAKCEHGIVKRNCGLCSPHISAKQKCGHGILKRKCGLCTPNGHNAKCGHGKLKRNCPKFNFSIRFCLHKFV
jgi:hypothetical protein